MGRGKNLYSCQYALNKDTISGLALWLDATDVDGDGNADSVSDGTALASWTDKSNAGETVNQTTGSSQPFIKQPFLEPNRAFVSTE